MKLILTISILAMTGCSKAPVVAASSAPYSHCYVPGEAHDTKTVPCVTIDK